MSHRNSEVSAQQAELFQLVVENVKEYAIFVTDTEGTVISWNPGVERLLGYTEEQIVGQSIEIIFTSEDRASGVPAQEMTTAARTGCAEDKRWHQRKDGTLFWANGKVMPLKNADGALRGYTKIMRDDTVQKSLEEQLRASESFNRNILASSVDCIKVLDLNGNILSMNAPGLCLMEIDDFSQFAGRRWTDFWKKDENQKAVNAVADAANGKIGRFRGYGETAKGNRKYWDVIVSPIFSENGKPERILSVSRDISDRKANEDSLALLAEISYELPLLKNSDEIKRLMTEKIGRYFGVANCVFAEVDTTLNTATVSDAWRVEAESVDLIGRYKLSEFVSDQFRETLLTGRPVVVSNVKTDPRTIKTSENLAQIKIGSFVNTPFIDGGDLKFVLGVYRPEAYEWRTTEIELLSELMARVWTRIERARAEEELRKSETKYRTLFDSIASGFCIIKMIYDDAGNPVDWRFLEANPAFEKNNSISNVGGKRIRELAPNIEPKWFEIYGRIAQTGEPERFIDVSEALGIWFDVYAFPVGEPEERKLAVLFNDISAQKNAEAERERMLAAEQELRTEAENANRLKDEFLATLSHELRTPLSSILGWSKILLSTDVGPEQRRKALETIDRNAQSQKQLIEDILDVSRIISGKFRLDVRAVDLAEVVAAAVETARPAAEAKNIRLQTLLDPEAAMISGDPDRLQQVVWNLLSNAVKFTPKEGRIQVRLERVNSHVEITVADTGKGIEADFLPYVFDRFRQSDGSMTRRQGGLGLGLAIVRQIVELHGGTVGVKSDGDGRGSEFTVCLPLLPNKQEPESEMLHAHPSAEIVESETGVSNRDLAGLRLLIVDNEEDSLSLLRAMLELGGAQVTSAVSAAQALEKIIRRRFDIIISDIGMPEEDGFSLIEKIRKLPEENGGKTPAVALTAYARAEDRIRALQSGFQMHIAKPVDRAELLAVVLSLAGKH